MTLTSKFYKGPVTDVDRAQNLAGAPEYGVYGPDDFKVSAHPSIPNALLVKAGKAHGHGVTDTAATDQVVQCATLSGSGAVRWDLISVRRDWQASPVGESKLDASLSVAMPVVPGTRLNNPGVIDDQPLALVEWRGGVNTPNQIIDLRCWAGNGGMVAAHVLALDYLKRPGADVMVGSTSYRYALGANSAWGWNEVSSGGAWVTLTPAPGWSAIGSPPRARLVAGGTMVQAQGELKRSTAMAEGALIVALTPALAPTDACYISGTTNLYRSAAIYLATAGGIRVGPAPVGQVAQFNGVFPRP